jgi:t-SNARE complex subunit (syntaxin)
MRQRYSKILVYSIAILAILLILVFVFLKQPAM